MNKEQSARKLRDMSEFYAAAVWDQINAKGASIVPEDICEAFVVGWDAGQKQLLSEAASGVELAITKVCGYYQHELDIELTVGDLSFFRQGYKQGRISAAAELAAKDAELAEAKELAKKLRGALLEYKKTDIRFMEKPKI